MKYLVALFVVSLALQPSGLQACAMDAEEPSGHHVDMQVDHKAACCDPQPDQLMDGCDSTTPCSFASVAVPVIPTGAGLCLVLSDHRFGFTNDDHYSGPPGPALFRPPIA